MKGPNKSIFKLKLNEFKAEHNLEPRFIDRVPTQVLKAIEGFNYNIYLQIINKIEI